MPEAVRVATLTTHRVNIGDDFIRDGALYLVERALGRPVREERVLRHDPRTASSAFRGRPILDRPNWRVVPAIYRLHRLLARRSREPDRLTDVDLIVHAGGPFFWWQQRRLLRATYLNSVFASELYRRFLLRTSEPPVALLAIGTSVTDRSEVDAMASDEASRRFVTELDGRAATVTSRDALSAEIWERVTGTAIPVLPCTSIYSPEANGVEMSADGDYYVMNYVPRGSHHPGKRAPEDSWGVRMRELYLRLRERGEVVVACHSQDELRATRELLPDARTFWSAEYADYIPFFAAGKGGIFNRVHGALVNIALGKPTVLVAADSRRATAEVGGEPQFEVHGAEPDALFAAFMEREARRHERLTELREIKADAEARYTELLRAALPQLVASS